MKCGGALGSLHSAGQVALVVERLGLRDAAVFGSSARVVVEVAVSLVGRGRGSWTSQPCAGHCVDVVECVFRRLIVEFSVLGPADVVQVEGDLRLGRSSRVPFRVPSPSPVLVRLTVQKLRGGRHGHVPLRNHVIHGGLGKHRLRLELLPVLPRPDVQSEFVALVGVLGAKAHVALVAGLQLQVLLAGGVGARGVLDGLEVAGRLPVERGSRRELFPFERGIDHGLLDVRVPDPCVVFAVFAIVALTCVLACLLPEL